MVEAMYDSMVFLGFVALALLLLLLNIDW